MTAHLETPVRAEAESQLQDDERLELGFHLLDIHGAFVLGGFVRYRAPAGSAVRHGIEFEPGDPAVEESLEAELAPYVPQSPAELLARLRRAADRLEAA